MMLTLAFNKSIAFNLVNYSKYTRYWLNNYQQFKKMIIKEILFWLGMFQTCFIKANCITIKVYFVYTGHILQFISTMIETCTIKKYFHLIHQARVYLFTYISKVHNPVVSNFCSETWGSRFDSCCIYWQRWALISNYLDNV